MSAADVRDFIHGGVAILLDDYPTYAPWRGNWLWSPKSVDSRLVLIGELTSGVASMLCPDWTAQVAIDEHRRATAFVAFDGYHVNTVKVTTKRNEIHFGADDVERFYISNRDCGGRIVGKMSDFAACFFTTRKINPLIESDPPDDELFGRAA